MIIKSIRPFNECFYYNCFHSALFAIIQANGGNYAECIACGIPHLEKQEWRHSKRILCRFNFKKEYSEILSESGFSIKEIKENEDLLEFAKKSLCQEAPVILNVDGFGLSYRNDLFQKKYWPHSLLVMGFDEKDNIFTVIDQPSCDNMKFQLYQISAEGLKNASQIYYQQRENNSLYLGEKDIALFPQFIPLKRENQEIIRLWIHNRKLEHHCIMEGIDMAYKQLPYFTAILSNTQLNSESGDYILDGFNDIVKQKRWEVVFVNKIFPGKQRIKEEAEEILSLWNQVRNYAGHIVLSRRMREKTLLRFQSTYKKALALEADYSNNLVGRI